MPRQCENKSQHPANKMLTFIRMFANILLLGFFFSVRRIKKIHLLLGSKHKRKLYLMTKLKFFGRAKESIISIKKVYRIVGIIAKNRGEKSQRIGQD